MSFVSDYRINQGDLVASGTLAFSHVDDISVTMLGGVCRQWFFAAEGLEVTCAGSPSLAENSLVPIVAQKGFWVAEGVGGQSFSARVGDRVEVHLRMKQFDGRMVFTLVPHPDAAMIFHEGRYQPLCRIRPAVSDYGAVRGYPPLHLTEFILMFLNAGGEFYGRSRESERAVGIWRNAIGINIYLDDYLTGPPPAIISHYTLHAADLDSTTLGRTQVTPRPTRGENYTILMARRTDWNTPDQPPTPNQFDWATVLTHEIGHAIGLDHFGNGVMNARLAPGTVINTLTADEISHAKAMYGL